MIVTRDPNFHSENEQKAPQVIAPSKEEEKELGTVEKKAPTLPEKKKEVKKNKR